MPYNFGTQSGLLQYGGDVDDTVGQNRSISTALNYKNFFAHADYDITSNVTAYVEGFYGKSNYDENGYLYYLRQGNLPISVDNAYLDPTIRSQLVAQGQTTFMLGKDTVDLGPPTSHNTRDVWRGVVGLNGQIGDSWKWHAYYTHGEVTAKLYAYNDTIISKFLEAVDAVRDPATNAIVCRSTLTNPTNGCAPLNVFGVGVASAAAKAYTHGTAYQRSNVQLDVASFDATGTLFSLPAGDVSIAFGGDYIRNQASSTQDALALARQYAVQNFQPFSGKRDVKEGFLETVIPILKDVPLAQRLEFNGAVRLTDYSTSGNVVTWKIGLSDQGDRRSAGPRHPVARHPRADAERSVLGRYPDSAAGAGSVHQQDLSAIYQRARQPRSAAGARRDADGRGDLQPEFPEGALALDRLLPHLAQGRDHLDQRGAGTAILLRGTAAILPIYPPRQHRCDHLDRHGADQRGEPADSRVGLRSGLPARARRGRVEFRALANYVPFFRQVDAIGNVTNFAGQIGDLNPGEPKLRANITTFYEIGRYSLALNAHILGGAKLQNAWVSGVDVDDNTVPSYATFSLSGSIKLRCRRQDAQADAGHRQSARQGSDRRSGHSRDRAIFGAGAWRAIRSLRPARSAVPGRGADQILGFAAWPSPASSMGGRGGFIRAGCARRSR